MAVRSRRRRVLLLAVACCTAAGIGAVAAARASHRPAAHATLRVLQMNLCNSGIAGCYTGRSVARAAEIIRSERPDLVTLNEICQADVATLEQAMPAGPVVTAFRPAVDGRTSAAVHCRNGEEYGIGLLARTRLRATTYGGEYPMQDSDDVEHRVWLCIRTDRYVCTTHLDSVTPSVAYQQCSFLLRLALPHLLAEHGRESVVLAGDLNLETGHGPDPRTCIPTGYAHADDDARQHVVATDYRIASSRTIDMRGTTDHPALLVDLAPTS